jgi:hypothetical protein
MKSALFLTLGVFVALPAFASTSLVTSGEVGSSIPPAETATTLADCDSNQGAVINADLGLQSTVPRVQGPCIPGNPGEPGDLAGFSFPVIACQEGFVKTTNVVFSQAQVGDQWQLYLWRDQGGFPLDACGMECAVANNPLTIDADGQSEQTYDWIPDFCPCVVIDQERIHIGVVYVNMIAPPDWFIGRNNFPRGPGFAYSNQTGNHGDWADMNDFGFGNWWGVELVIGTECSIVPVEPTSWGVLKSLYDF